MNPKKIHRRWQRRFALGLERVGRFLTGCRRTGSVEAVHDLRVALRRGRLMALIGKPLLDKRAVNGFRDWARGVSDALGAVRDCDVAIDWLCGQKQAVKPIEFLRLRRARQWRTAKPRLTKQRHPDLHRLAPDTAGDSGSKKLARRFEREVCGAVSMFEKCAPRFRKLDAIQLHELRRDVRRWRYLREIVLSRREQKRDRGLKLLVDFQEALGEAQNLEVIVKLLSVIDDLTEARSLAKAARSEQKRWLKRERKRLATLVKSKLARTQLAEF